MNPTARRLAGLAPSPAGAPRPGRRGPGRRRDGSAPVEVEVPVLLDLLDAACAAGASIPRALAVVGGAVEGERGTALCRAAGQLVLGSRWVDAWAGSPPALEPVAASLRASWEDGAAPGAGLRRMAEAQRRSRHARAVEAANRLGVRLVLPLGLCYLPAFVLVGLVPVLMSMAAGVLGP